MESLINENSEIHENDLVDRSITNEINKNKVLVAHFTERNIRRTQEDRLVVIDDLNTAFDLDLDLKYSYYAIFDGHSGCDAAEYAKNNLHCALVSSEHFKNNHIEKAFLEAFKHIDNILCNELNTSSGSTAICCLIENLTNVYIAWAGDSSAILSQNGEGTLLCKPHKPNRQDECERIEKQGGKVYMLDTWRVNGILAVSRSFGDTSYKPYVTAEPEINVFKLKGDEDFIILASDGLWDTVDLNNATNFVYFNLANNQLDDTKEAANNIALGLSNLAKSKGSDDNITVIIIFLKELSKINLPSLDELSFDSESDLKLSKKDINNSHLEFQNGHYQNGHANNSSNEHDLFENGINNSNMNLPFENNDFNNISLSGIDSIRALQQQHENDVNAHNINITSNEDETHDGNLCSVKSNIDYTDDNEELHSILPNINDQLINKNSFNPEQQESKTQEEQDLERELDEERIIMKNNEKIDVLKEIDEEFVDNNNIKEKKICLNDEKSSYTNVSYELNENLDTTNSNENSTEEQVNCEYSVIPTESIACPIDLVSEPSESENNKLSDCNSSTEQLNFKDEFKDDFKEDFKEELSNDSKDNLKNNFSSDSKGFNLDLKEESNQDFNHDFQEDSKENFKDDSKEELNKEFNDELKNYSKADSKGLFNKLQTTSSFEQIIDEQDATVESVQFDSNQLNKPVSNLNDNPLNVSYEEIKSEENSFEFIDKENANNNQQPIEQNQNSKNLNTKNFVQCEENKVYEIDENDNVNQFFENNENSIVIVDRSKINLFDLGYLELKKDNEQVDLNCENKHENSLNQKELINKDGIDKVENLSNIKLVFDDLAKNQQEENFVFTEKNLDLNLNDQVNQNEELKDLESSCNFEIIKSNNENKSLDIVEDKVNFVTKIKENDFNFLCERPIVNDELNHNEFENVEQIENLEQQKKEKIEPDQVNDKNEIVDFVKESNDFVDLIETSFIKIDKNELEDVIKINENEKNNLIESIENIDLSYNQDDLIQNEIKQKIEIETELQQNVPEIETQKIFLETQNIVCEIKKQNIMFEIETQYIAPEIETQNITPGIESQNIVPKIETQDIVPEIETQSVAPEIKTSNIVPEIETQKFISGQESSNKNELNLECLSDPKEQKIEQDEIFLNETKNLLLLEEKKSVDHLKQENNINELKNSEQQLNNKIVSASKQVLDKKKINETHSTQNKTLIKSKTISSNASKTSATKTTSSNNKNKLNNDKTSTITTNKPLGKVDSSKTAANISSKTKSNVNVTSKIHSTNLTAITKTSTSTASTKPINKKVNSATSSTTLTKTNLLNKKPIKTATTTASAISKLSTTNKSRPSTTVSKTSGLASASNTATSKLSNVTSRVASIRPKVETKSNLLTKTNASNTTSATVLQNKIKNKVNSLSNNRPASSVDKFANITSKVSSNFMKTKTDVPSTSKTTNSNRLSNTKKPSTLNSGKTLSTTNKPSSLSQNSKTTSRLSIGGRVTQSNKTTNPKGNLTSTNHSNNTTNNSNNNNSNNNNNSIKTTAVPRKPINKKPIETQLDANHNQQIVCETNNALNDSKPIDHSLSNGHTNGYYINRTNLDQNQVVQTPSSMSTSKSRDKLTNSLKAELEAAMELNGLPK